MKSTLAVFVLSAFATCVFTMERITAAESSAAATAACTGCCEKSCSGAQSCCQQAQTTASTACPASDVKANVASITTSATTTCCGEECACSCESSCCKQQETTAAHPKPVTIAGIPAATIANGFVALKSAECADCCSCKSKCTTACAAELERTGLDPYRIEPPDVLSIYVPILAPTCAEAREKLAAKGISLDVELPCSNAECEQIVGPDGRIAVDGIGDIYVSGMTVEEARLAITKKIFEACPQAKRAVFGVVVNVSAFNSKKYYVIRQGAGLGDNVTESPVTGNETVLDAISHIGGIPQVSSTNIWIARPASNGAGGEQILPVNWDEITRGTCTVTNYQLLPGDRLFVQVAKEAAPPAPQAPVTIAIPPISIPPAPYCAPQPPIAPQLSSPLSPVTPYTPSATFITFFPEEVQPLFAPEPCAPGITPQLLATQALVCPSPLQVRPVAAAHAPQCAAECNTCSSASCVTCETCASDAKSSAKIAQVRFDVEIIEDHTGSLQEFSALESDMPILTAESEVILPTIRILEKRELVRRISSPRLITVVDQPAQIHIGSEVRSESGGKPSFHGLMLKTAAREIGGGLNVDFQFRKTNGGEALEVETSLLVAHGQTIVMKTTGRHGASSESGERNAGDQPAVYVVLTPELIK